MAAPFDLTWQGRLLDEDGTALNGTYNLTLTLYVDGVAEWSHDYTQTSVADGYVSVVLADVLSEWMTSTVEVQASVGTMDLLPRQTLTSSPRALVARAAPVSTGLGTCTDKGQITFDDDADVLRVCDGTGWSSGGFALASAACTSNSEGALRWTGSALQVCLPGNVWSTVASGDNGASAQAAGTSCKAIHDAYPELLSGPYYIDPDGGDHADAYQVYCDMETDDGGWTLVIKHSQNGMPNTSAAWDMADMAVLAVSGNAKLADTEINGMTWTSWRIEAVGDAARHLRSTNGTQFNVSWPAYYTSWSNGSTDNGRNQQWCYYEVPAFGTQCSTLGNTNTYGVAPHEASLGGVWWHNTFTSGGNLGGFSCGFGSAAETNCNTTTGRSIRHWVR